MTKELQLSDIFDMAIPYRVSTDGMESALGDETVILHLGKGTYFGIDAVGTDIWTGLKRGETPREICTRISEAYDDVPDTVEDDIRAFLLRLLEQDLIAPAQE